MFLFFRYFRYYFRSTSTALFPFGENKATAVTAPMPSELSVKEVVINAVGQNKAARK